jgi:hypothetical protein
MRIGSEHKLAVLGLVSLFSNILPEFSSKYTRRIRQESKSDTVNWGSAFRRSSKETEIMLTAKMRSRRNTLNQIAVTLLHAKYRHSSCVPLGEVLAL